MEKARKRRRRGKRRGLPPLYLDSGYGLEEVRCEVLPSVCLVHASLYVNVYLFARVSQKLYAQTL